MSHILGQKMKVKQVRHAVIRDGPYRLSEVRETGTRAREEERNLTEIENRLTGEGGNETKNVEDSE